MPSKRCDRLIARTKLYFLRIDKLHRHNFLIIADSWTAIQRLGCEHVHLPFRLTRRSPPDGEQINCSNGEDSNPIMIIASSWNEVSWKTEPIRCDCVFYPYFQGFMEVRSLLVVYVFTSSNSPERSPMERRTPAQGSSRDQCTRGPSSGTTRTQLLFKFY